MFKPFSSRFLRSQSGVTLIEMLVVTAVIMILTTLAQPLSETVSRRAKEVTLKRQLKNIRTAIDVFKADWDRDGEKRIGPLCQENELACLEISSENGYPHQLEDLVKPENAAGTQALSPHYLRSLPIDPMTGNANWGLRCYADPEDTETWCGEDVFDVYSKSEAVAMNQTEYRTW